MAFVHFDTLVGFIRVFQIHPARHSADPVVHVGHLEHIGRVLVGIGSLHQHRFIDPGGLDLRFKFGRFEGAVQWPIGRNEPRVHSFRQVPEMLMGIYFDCH
jgi:hypothetical protein